MSVGLNTEQQGFYEQVRQQCATEVAMMNATMVEEWNRLNAEIARVQELIQVMETRKISVAQMYGSASEMLGLPNDLDASPAIQE